MNRRQLLVGAAAAGAALPSLSRSVLTRRPRPLPEDCDSKK